MEQNQSHKSDIVAAIGYCLLAIGLTLIVILSFALSEPLERQLHGGPAFERAAEKAVFQRLLAKHGLQYDVSVIYEDALGRYFIRNGQRCPFK